MSSAYFPEVAWSTLATNVMVGSTTYRYKLTVNYLDPNEPGAISMVMAVGDWFIDYAGFPFIIEEIVGNQITVYDINERGDGVISAYGPYPDKIGYVYRPKNGAIILTQAQLRKLDVSASDIIYPIEKGIIWKYRGINIIAGASDIENITKVELQGIGITSTSTEGWQGGSKAIVDLVYPSQGIVTSTGTGWGTSIVPMTGYMYYNGTDWIFKDESYSLVGHTHSVSEIVDLQAALDGKVYDVMVQFDENLAKASNASSYLTTPTYDGSGQVVHPDVYYNPLKWPDSNGYKFWMAMTPYPNGNAAYENPSILVSNDGQTWSVPSGLTNPIEPAPTIGHYNDPDILEGADEKLWIFFGWTDNTTHKVYVKSSSNGIDWSSKTEILSSTTEWVTSPAVILNEGLYTMWYVDILSSPNVIKKRTASTPDGVWSSPITVSVSNIPSGKDIWHLDVVKTENEYHAFVVFCDLNTSGANSKLYFATSTDGDNWTIGSTPVLDKSSSGGWDDTLIYRSSGILLDVGYEKRYALWYSADNSSRQWHVGYTEVFLSPVYVKSTGNVGIGKIIPTEKLDVDGNIRTTGQLISTVATGTAPLSVLSTTLVSNLNADLLDGLHKTSFGASLGVSGNDVVLKNSDATVLSTITVPYATNADLLDNHDSSYFQVALTNPVTGIGTVGYIPKFTGTSVIGDSPIYTDGTNVGIATVIPFSKLHVGEEASQISVGLQGSSGDVHFGSSGIASPSNGTQDYGFYVGYNAYRKADGNWYHSRPNTVDAGVFGFESAIATGGDGFYWRYTTNGGAGAISMKDLMTLTTAGGLKLNGTLGILEGGATPTYYTILQGGDQTGNITYTLPTSAGLANQVLSTDGTGVLSWVAAAGGSLPSGTAGQTLRHNGTAWIANSFLYNDGTRIGIEGYSSSAKLYVYCNLTSSSGYTTQNELLQTMTVNGTITDMAFYNYAQTAINNGITNSGSLFGIYDTVFHTSAGTLNQLVGHNICYGSYTGAGTINNAYGLFIIPYYTAGTVTNMYDIYLGGEIIGGTATNKWGIYQFNTKNNRLSGNLGLGINPSHQLELSLDDAWKPGTTTWKVSSDARLKDKGLPYVRGLKEIMQINPTYYKYKKNNVKKIDDDREFVGIIAQEIKDVIPEAVLEDKEGYLSYSADPTIWAMLNAIKELKTENDNLRTEINSLKEEIVNIKQIISKL